MTELIQKYNITSIEEFKNLALGNDEFNGINYKEAEQAIRQYKLENDPEHRSILNASLGKYGLSL